MAPENRRDVVARTKAMLEAMGVSLAGPCGAFEITSRVAWALRDEGAGLLEKTVGNHCRGFAVDIVAFRDGSYVDILVDSGGANGPTWQVRSDRIDVARWRAPIDPGDVSPDDRPPGPPAVPPPPPVDPSDALARVIDEASARIVGALTELILAVHEGNEVAKELQRDGLRVKFR